MQNSKVFDNLIVFALLYNIWLCLSATFELFYLAAGALSCAFATAINASRPPQPASRVRFRMSAIIYFLWLTKEIFVASVTTIKRTYAVKLEDNGAFAAVEHPKYYDDAATAMLFFSITLTPGTISALHKGSLIITHFYNKEDISTMDQSVPGSIARFAITRR